MKVAVVIAFALWVVCNGLSSSNIVNNDEGTMEKSEQEITRDDASGSCGPGVHWDLQKTTLTIFGNGDMTNYTNPGDVPWYKSLSF